VCFISGLGPQLRPAPFLLGPPSRICDKCAYRAFWNGRYCQVIDTSLEAAQTSLPAGLDIIDLDRIAAASEASRSPSTRRAYASALRRWTAWCAGRGVEPDAAGPEHVAAWIAELAAAGRSASTIQVALAALAADAHDAGIPDPTAHPGVRRVVAGLRRTVGTAPRRQAHPVTTAEVRRIVVAIEGDGLRALRDRALILLGYAAALRRSELADLRLADIVQRRGGFVIRVRSSKTDQEAVGQVVGVTRGQHHETDPVSALSTWTTVAELSGDDELWPPISWSDRRVIRERHLGGHDVARILRSRAADAGLGDLPISGHSLRAGHATEAASRGVPADRLMRTTRYRSMSGLAPYVRPAEALRDTTSADLGL